MTCRRPFQATATELRAEILGNVCTMDLEAADELQTTPLRDFARARMQEIYDKISDAETNQTLSEIYDQSEMHGDCLLYTSPSPRDGLLSRMPSSA